MGMNRRWLWLGSVLVLIAIGAYFWLRQASQPLPPPIPVVSPPAVAPRTETVQPKPAVSYPVPAPIGATELPPLKQADDFVKEQIEGLLGANIVKKYRRIDHFVRSVVAAVDNLARPFVPPHMWPIHTTLGRFTIENGSDGTVIAAKNAARYAPFVALVESVDTGRAVALYQRLYPLFQRAYEELGYPGRYFNDRLVAVIDLLLEMPEPSGALEVELPEMRGPLKPTHPCPGYFTK